MASRTRWGPDPLAPAVPRGVQPEQDGLLQCLECDRWYRQLGQHVVGKHHISADDYRRVHELPATRGLHAADILARRAETGRARWANDPALRERLVPTRTTAAERIAASREARRASAKRAGVKASAAAAGRRANAAWLTSIDQRHLATVTVLGFESFEEFWHAHAHLSNPQAARLLGISTKQAAALRARHGHRPPGRWPEGHILKHPGITKPLPAADLARIPAGVQPIRAGGHLACRICGRWFASLTIHLAATHRITAAGYLAAYHLPANIVLHASAQRAKDHAEREEIWAERTGPHGPGPDHAGAYRRTHGHLHVPATYAADDGYRLGAWITAQRARHRRGLLPPDQGAALEAIGMAWTSAPPLHLPIHERGYHHAQIFFLDHGHLQVPGDYTTTSGFPLGRWIARMRLERERAALDPVTIAALEEIAMTWQRPPGAQRGRTR